MDLEGADLAGAVEERASRVNRLDEFSGALMPLSTEEETELATMVLKMGEFDLGASLTPFRGRSRGTRERWRASGWIDSAGNLTTRGRSALEQLVERRGHG